MRRKIGILCASDSELEPFLPLLTDVTVSESAMLKVYDGRLDGMPAAALYSGVCKVNAAVAAQVLLDDWICGYAMPDQIRKMIPMDIRVEDTFDPKKAGWKLILDEEFDGDSLNPNLWTRTFARKGIQLKDGFLELRATRKPAGNGKVIYETNGFSTVKKYSYGYYEARVRVRDCSGWITAFWLYGGQTGNSYLDGMEVDVYEDYYVFPGKPLLDFNFHGFVGRVMKSWNLSGCIQD